MKKNARFPIQKTSASKQRNYTPEGQMSLPGLGLPPALPARWPSANLERQALRYLLAGEELRQDTFEETWRLAALIFSLSEKGWPCHKRRIDVAGRTRALLDVQAGWILVDAAGPKSESMVSALREALPPFPARLPHTLLSPSSAMTLWITGTLPDGFELDCDAVMRSPGDDGATVRCSRQDLTAREVQKHIETGKVVTQLGLVWRQRIRFVLTDRLELKRLQFLDVLEEQASQAGDDAPALFDATATLMLGELRQLVSYLIAYLGGESGEVVNAKQQEVAA